MDRSELASFNPMHQLGQSVDRGVRSAQEGLSAAAKSVDTHVRGRALTQGELGMIRWMFGIVPGVERAHIYPRNFWWPYRNDRAMTPNGSIYFPSQDFRDDFSSPSVPVQLRALFMHESTHLYQTYTLGMWMVPQGLFDRNYSYELKKGRLLKDYGLEQMGQIVQDFYLWRNGGRPSTGFVRLTEYADALPVRR